jgi:feruloyl-CoA synthase
VGVADEDSMFARPDISVERRPDGTTVLASRQPLAPYPSSLGVMLRQWASERPDVPFLCERDGSGGWRRVTFGEASATADAIGQSLLERELGPERPVMALSGNSVDHALLMLGCFVSGVTFVPISVAYSLLSTDHAQLRHCVERTEPGLVYVASEAVFAPALAAVDFGGAELVASAASDKAIAFSDLTSTRPGADLASAFDAVGPETVAKILFTSGSTGLPKGVPNTHGMLCANQQALAQVWPFVADEPPVLVDWMPWNHTFGGSHDFNMVLRNGGTLYIDEGKPVPGLVEATVANLREVSPTVYLNVPRGYAALLPFLESDDELAENFFARLRLIFYAGAALPPELWDRLDRLARRVTGGPVPMTTAWGSTETSPLATSAHFPLDGPGNIGVPVPGTAIKLVPDGSKLELRVKGPNVFSGYWRDDEQTAEAFDDEGFYRIGDAGRLVDPDDPAAGIMFEGRVAEDFKLTTGSWVSVTHVRTRVVSVAAPLILDAVVTGHDRDEIGVMAWIDTTAAARLFDISGGPAEAVADHRIRNHVAEAIARHNREEAAATRRVARLLLLADPPAIDANEITDKGYINQRAVLERRAEHVQLLYAEPAHPDVIRP